MLVIIVCVSTKLPPVSNLGVTNSEWSVKAAMLATQTRQVKLSCKKSTRSTFLQAQLVLLKVLDRQNCVG